MNSSICSQLNISLNTPLMIYWCKYSLSVQKTQFTDKICAKKTQLTDKMCAKRSKLTEKICANRSKLTDKICAKKQLTDKICAKGQNWHMKAGRSQRWTSAALNWKGKKHEQRKTMNCHPRWKSGQSDHNSEFNTLKHRYFQNFHKNSTKLAISCQMIFEDNADDDVDNDVL